MKLFSSASGKNGFQFFALQPFDIAQNRKIIIWNNLEGAMSFPRKRESVEPLRLKANGVGFRFRAGMTPAVER
jgi:hypothetical protein